MCRERRGEDRLILQAFALVEKKQNKKIVGGSNMENQTKMQKWCYHGWLKVVLVISFIVMLAIALNIDHWSKELLVLAAILPTLAFHMVEEGHFPGGFGYSHNIVMGGPERVDRYKLNMFNDMIVNFGCFIVYLVLIVCSLVMGYVPVGFLFPVMLLCCLECIVHTATGIYMKKLFKAYGKKTIYTPGIFSAYFVMLPLIVWMIQIFVGSTLTGKDWITGIALCVFQLVLIFAPESIPAMTTKIYDRYPYPDHGYFEKYLELQKEKK